MRKIFIIFAIIFSTTAYAEKNDIVIPKYFFANELTKETCSLEGVHGFGSWGKAYWEMDLAITHVSDARNPELQGNNYDHLMELTKYDWNKDHELSTFIDSVSLQERQKVTKQLIEDHEPAMIPSASDDFDWEERFR